MINSARHVGEQISVAVGAQVTSALSSTRSVCSAQAASIVQHSKCLPFDPHRAERNGPT